MSIMQPLELDPQTYDFYRRSLEILNKAKIPFLIGGGFAFERHTGIVRETKDLDLFIRARDCQRALQVLSQAGYQTTLSVSHWLAKAYCGDNFVDLIFNSAMGACEVDDSWFEQVVVDKVMDMSVRLCPPEEMIWMKSYLMARDRFDGADVAHLLRACSDRLDWSRLLKRFGAHWRVFLSHLVLFGFIYPGERARIPSWVMDELIRRLERETLDSAASTERLCQGTLLAPMQYQIDVKQWGYQDARVQPSGNLTETEVINWLDHLQQEREEG
ncbi:nucleotidyltransferase [Pleurocapsales cyanobacterium LEGE 06147]|nr:nucleotidyltransferase [Pleurocapsales cyanobacterium LEGE 06147]